MACARLGMASEVQALLERGADPDMVDEVSESLYASNDTSRKKDSTSRTESSLFHL